MRKAGTPTPRWKRPTQIFYGWYLVGITIFTLAVVISPVFQGLGTFFVALERHFGWSRTLLSGAFSLARAEGALLGPIEGFLTDRLGPRRIVLIGYVTLGIGLIALNFIQNVVSFYVVFIIMFTGAGLGGFLPLMAVLNHWFVRRRATAMAVGMTGINLGGLLVPGLALAITTAGWRTTAFGLGVFVLVLAFPVSSLIRNRPEEYGLRPDGDPPIDQSPQAAATPGQAYEEDDGSFTIGQALRTWAFWAITIAHGFSAIAAVTVAIHIIPAMTDIGMSLPVAGLVVTAYTMTGVAFQLLAGFIGDRFPKPPAIAAFVAIQGSGMLVAATIHTVPGAFLFAVLYGIGFGGRVPLLTSIRGDYFGRKSYATILGFSQFPMNIAIMGAPIAAGYLFDTLGSYTVPFLGLSALNFLGAALILLARKPRLPESRQHGQVTETIV